MLDEWLAGFEFSRSVHHPPRDFSDAVLMAELLAQLLPAGAVGLHNYLSTGRYQQKLINWDVLNRRVLTPIGCELSCQQMENLAGAASGAISVLLVRVKQQTDKKLSSSKPTGKPPRSPTKTTSKTARELESHRSGIATPPLIRKAQSVSKLQSYRSARGDLQKTTGHRSPTAASMAATVASPSRSAPLSPRTASASRTLPPRSQYSSLDYLPSSNERATADALLSTFTRVPQVTDTRQTPHFKRRSADTPRSPAIRSPPVLLLAKVGNATDSGAQSQTQTDTTPLPDALDCSASASGTSPLHDHDVSGRNTPTSLKLPSPPRQYTTKVLSRHIFTFADMRSPVELRAVEPATEPTSQSSPGSATEPSNNAISAEDLCSKPTVFAPVSIDVSAILNTLPLKCPPSRKKNC